MDRRVFLTSLAVISAARSHASSPPDGEPERMIRARRLVRHRIRRRVTVRTVVGRRPFLVVPEKLAAGWELTHASQVVVVVGFRWVTIDGRHHEVAVVQAGDGPTDEIEILREDTADNAIDLPGSALDVHDIATPALEDSPR